MIRPRTRRSKRSLVGDDRAQIVLVAAAVVAVAFLSMTAAYAQLGYDADRSGAGAVDVASVSDIDRSLTESLRLTVRERKSGAGSTPWRDRRIAVERVRGSMADDLDRLERAHASESRSLTVEYDDAAATRWTRTRCPDGPGREFGPCRSVDGVVVQERAGETTVVAVAFRIRIVSPAESTTATVIPRVIAASKSRSPATTASRKTETD